MTQIAYADTVDSIMQEISEIAVYIMEYYKLRGMHLKYPTSISPKKYASTASTVTLSLQNITWNVPTSLH